MFDKIKVINVKNRECKMSTENNCEKILEEVCEKISKLDSIKEIDVLEIKNSVESIESLITDNQAKLNFQEIKDKLEVISDQVDSCNEAILKDLFNDINALKETSTNVNQHLENLQNVQNLALTSAEFEEYQKQQLDLALKTNENIFNELSAIKENSQGVYSTENISRLETQLENLHKNLTSYIEQMVTKIEDLPDVENFGAIMSDLNSVQQKTIKQTNTLIKEFQAKFENIETKFDKADFQNQFAKISEIYDSLAIIRSWIDKAGNINQAIENVYARLGESIDFDDVAEKVDIIYENIRDLNSWTEKIENVDGAVTDMQSKLASISTFMADTKNISNTISIIKEKFEGTFSENLDLENVSNKIDIVYDNLSALNSWAETVDVISEKVSTMNTAFEDDFLSSKIDIIYENIALLNEWVSKVDTISSRSEELDSKIDELGKNLENANKIIVDVPDIKDKLENLSGELNTITRSTKNDADSYVYTLLDIETDFLKLHKYLDDKTNVTTQDINSLKEKFEDLNNDISSISIRTNKLILSADDANKEFKSYLQTFKDIIQELQIQKNDLNPEEKFAVLGEKITEMFKLMQSNLVASKNLNDAFSFLAEWVDATGVILNNMSKDIASLKGKKITPSVGEEDSTIKNEIIDSLNRVTQLEETVALIKNEEISEIKSLLTGIMVQLNTALTPDIDTLNERIDKLSEENNNKFTELETLMKEKINQQSKQIASLEAKVDDLSSKLVRFLEVMSEHNNNYELKDILSYIATQTAAVNDAIANGRISEMADKLSSFDANINKIVSYIEED